jgi:hypothetical protein
VRHVAPEEAGAVIGVDPDSVPAVALQTLEDSELPEERAVKRRD